MASLWLLAACSPAAGGNAPNNTASTTEPIESPTQALEPVTVAPEASATIVDAPTMTVAATATSAVSPTLEATPLPSATTDSGNVPDDGSGVAEILPTDLVITFTQEGGIAGLQLELVIDSSGRVMQDETVIRQLTPEEMTTLYQTLLDNDFFTLAPDYRAEDICCDFFVYTLTVHANGETTDVRTVGGPPDTPDWLWNTLQPFIAIADQAAMQ